MKEKQFLIAWLEETFPDKRYYMKPIQQHFDEQLKNYRNNVIYFGLFSGNVSVLTPFQQSPIQINETHTRPFVFSHLAPNSSVDHTFIGFEISFLDLLIQHSFETPSAPDDVNVVNQIFIRLGGCNVTDTNLFTMYHRNGVIYNEIECLTPFNGVNETYSFSYDMVHFYSCNINALGQISTLETCVLSEPPVDPPTLPITWWQAVHPLGHAGTDNVTYLDANGDEQIQVFTRTNDINENPCESVEGIVVRHNGVVTCQPEINPILTLVHNGMPTYTLPDGRTSDDYNIRCFNSDNSYYEDHILTGFSSSVFYLEAGWQSFIYLISDPTVHSLTVSATVSGGSL